MTYIQTIDFKILNWIQSNFRNPTLDRFMCRITSLGDAGVIWLTISLMLMGSQRYRIYGYGIVCELILCVVVGNIGIKSIACRPRPCSIIPDYPLLISRPKDTSFPSAHTMTSFAAATIIFHANHFLGIGAFFLAGLIAFSRLYLYVHFPSDVLAGFLIGIFLAWNPICSAIL